MSSVTALVIILKFVKLISSVTALAIILKCEIRSSVTALAIGQLCFVMFGIRYAGSDRCLRQSLPLLILKV